MTGSVVCVEARSHLLLGGRPHLLCLMCTDSLGLKPKDLSQVVFYEVNFKNLFRYFMFRCPGSFRCTWAFLQLRQGGLLSSGSAGLLAAERGALGAWTRYLWLTGFVASRHVGSSCIRDQTHVPSIGRPDSYPLSHQDSPQIVF